MHISFDYLLNIHFQLIWIEYVPYINNHKLDWCYMHLVSNISLSMFNES